MTDDILRVKGALEFDLVDVRSLMAHARASRRHQMGFEERCEIYGEDVLWEQPDETERAAPGLFLCKDEGVYLMSSGIADNTGVSFLRKLFMRED